MILNITTPGLRIIGEWVVETDEGQVTSHPDNKPVQAMTQEQIDTYRAWDGVESLPMKDATRIHDGKTWISLINNNVWEPPVGWREVVAEGYPEWVQPTGAHDAYQMGDRVTFEGASYESTIDANTWSPSVYPAGWTAL